MKPDLTRFAPPGVDVKKELRLYLTGLGLAAFWSLGWLYRWAAALSELYIHWPDGTRVLNSERVMPWFFALMQGAPLGFALMALCMPALAVYHLLYFYQDSRSIYLMRRLPARGELLRRVLILPLMGLGGIVLTALILGLIYLGLYLVGTPESALLPDALRFILVWGY